MINEDFNSEPVITVKDLSKVYRVIDSPLEKFLYYVFGMRYGSDFYALKNISFDIRRGETFGIIGVNGSGKSTLLQIIAGIIPLTSGEIKINGKVSALLELGSGFNPDSTGYENIYLNAAILGVSKNSIDKKINEIIEFASIGDFIYQPVKTYSSGMFVRLAFAVAINVEADIIIIDEALAVGDIFFRQKCYSKLNELKQQGKTIILVSHGMNEVEQFCDRALLLNHGEQVCLDKSIEVVAKYYMLNQESIKNPIKSSVNNEEDNIGVFEKSTFFKNKWKITENVFFNLDKSDEHSNGKAHYLRIGLFDSNGKSKRIFKQGEYAYFYSELYIDCNISVPINGVVITNQKAIIVHGKSSFQTNEVLPRNLKKGNILHSCVRIKMDIEEGEYTFECGFSTMPYDIYLNRSRIPHEEIFKNQTVLAVRRGVGAFAIQGKIEETPSQLNFYGLVNLKSEFDINVAKGEINNA